jgi:hypothetical protein
MCTTTKMPWYIPSLNSGLPELVDARQKNRMHAEEICSHYLVIDHVYRLFDLAWPGGTY